MCECPRKLFQQGEDTTRRLLWYCVSSIDIKIEELYSQVCVWRLVDANYVAAGYK